jgi:hypothetical protein
MWVDLFGIQEASSSSPRPAASGEWQKRASSIELTRSMHQPQLKYGTKGHLLRYVCVYDNSLEFNRIGCSLQAFSGKDFFVPSPQREVQGRMGPVLNYAGVGCRISDIRYGGGVGAACPATAGARL